MKYIHNFKTIHSIYFKTLSIIIFAALSHFSLFSYISECVYIDIILKNPNDMALLIAQYKSNNLGGGGNKGISM